MRDASTVAAVDAHRVVHDKLEDELSAARSLDAVGSKLKLFIDVANRSLRHVPSLSLQMAAELSNFQRYTLMSTLCGKRLLQYTKYGLEFSACLRTY